MPVHFVSIVATLHEPKSAQGYSYYDIVMLCKKIFCVENLRKNDPVHVPLMCIINFNIVIF